MQHLHSSALTALALATAQMLAAGSAAATPITARFATFNASLNRTASAELLSDLANPSATGANITAANRIQQAHNVAEIIQRIRADVLLINEFDFDLSGTPTASSTAMPLGYSSQAAALFQQNFLSAAHGNAVRGTSNAVNYAYRYTPNTNTGIASGFDLNNNGSTVTTPGAAGYGDDAFGFGTFAGQFGFTVYSKFEIVRVRSFQNFKWKDMPGNLLTNDPTANKLNDFYSAAEVDALRLSSKNHVDVTLRINGQDVHFLTAHPSPPRSMALKTATASATTTRSGSGPTTSQAVRKRPTCTTTKAAPGAWRPAPSLSLPVTTTPTRWTVTASEAW